MRRALVWLLAASAAGCVSGASLRLESETMTTRLDAARQGGAYRCAPKELARTETQLDFLLIEIDQGNSVRAIEHRDRAKASLDELLERLKACPPEKAPEPPPPPPSDRDGDGILDEADKCPDAAEDKDGYEDEDGCPEDQDRDHDGLNNEVDRCPDVAGPKENQGCPIDDRDHDAILDKDDKCPDDPEDKDKFEDEDGCPDPDNDKDGILDVNDKCPDLPETKNNFQDEDGCPDIDPSLVVVNRDLGKIEIKQKVYFDTNKATIKKVSFALLNEVASALRTNPELDVLVEGHTDSVGKDATNLKLSNARANSVRQYLIGQGIDPQRLTAIGYGETRPISDNETPEGREANRRVEFTIVKE